MFSVLAEFEREITKDRTKSGLEAARKRGSLTGRPKGLSDDAKIKAKAAAAMYKEGKLTISQICQNLGVSNNTLYKYIRHEGVKVGEL